MNILILGSGGREHTFAWKIAQSPKCEKLFVAPGNSGTAQVATNVNIGVTDFPAIKKLVLDNKINMVVVGPEDPLVQGVHDYFLNDDAIKHVAVIGPRKNSLANSLLPANSAAFCRGPITATCLMASSFKK